MPWAWVIHLSSRDALLSAVADRMTEKVAEEMDAAGADEGPALLSP